MVIMQKHSKKPIKQASKDSSKKSSNEKLILLPIRKGYPPWLEWAKDVQSSAREKEQVAYLKALARQEIAREIKLGVFPPKKKTKTLAKILPLIAVPASI